MNELEFLKDIGLREIARKTHIEPEFLGYILNKEFEKLGRVNAMGYIKILQREYEIDLSSWIDEYKAYLGEHKDDEVQKTSVTPKIFVYTNENDASHKPSNILGLLAWIAALAAVFGVAYYFELHKYLQNLPSFFNDENRSAVYSQNSMVQEVRSSLPEANITIVTAPIKTENNELEPQISQPEQNLSLDVADENISNGEEQILTPPQIVVSLDQNAGTQNSALERLTSDISQPRDSNMTQSLGFGEKAVIAPKQRVWIGIINLQTGKKTSLDSNKPVEINLKERQLVVCGNGNVELKVGEKTSKFDGGRSARFLVEDGNIRQISYEEFVEINKGKSW